MANFNNEKEKADFEHDGCVVLILAALIAVFLLSLVL